VVARWVVRVEERAGPEGSHRLIRAAAPKAAAEVRGKPLPPEQIERRRRTARKLNLGQYLDPAQRRGLDGGTARPAGPPLRRPRGGAMPLAVSCPSCAAGLRVNWAVGRGPRRGGPTDEADYRHVCGPGTEQLLRGCRLHARAASTQGEAVAQTVSWRG